MSESLKLVIASFKLREKREPNEKELELLKEMAEEVFEKNTQSGCMINYN